MIPPAPPASTQAVRSVMSANKKRDTVPELRVRAALFARGLRYRTHCIIRAPGVRVRPDVVFTSRRIAVFIDGCYWHVCPVHGVSPKTNASYWEAKLSLNLRRDEAINASLADAGWTVRRFWEHEDPQSVADRLVLLVKGGLEGETPVSAGET